MKILPCLIVTCTLLTAACDMLPDFGKPSRMAYYFDAPATTFEESLPLGNGRIGMMSDGGIDRETIVLNEITLWSGSRQDADNPDAARMLGRVRELIFDGRPDEAESLMKEAFVCRGVGTNSGDAADKPFGSYQVLGSLHINYSYDGSERASTADYCRELDLENAVSTVSFRRGKATYTREAFTSFTNDVAVLRLTADRECTLKLQIGITRPERYTVTTDSRELEIHGRLYVGDGVLGTAPRAQGDSGTVVEDSASRAARLEGGGVRYAARVRVLLPNGGEIRSADDTTLDVQGAPEVILLVGMATDYFGASPDEAVRKQLDAASSKPYEVLRSEHIAAYRERFDRVKLRIGRSGWDNWPITKRLEAFAHGRRDPSLVALYYQFGRYLLIASTRPGSLPPTAQGLWCPMIHTPSEGAYRSDGPLEMCFLPAETGNLPELITPLEEWTKRLAAAGRNTAATCYGARGWTAHASGNAWDFASPDRDPRRLATPTAARICGPLYDHFRFTRDTAYLRSVYPLIRDAALFLVDRLTEDPRSRRLVVVPGTSAGNVYTLPDGRNATVCAGATVDNMLAHELLSNALRAAEILHMDAELIGPFSACLARLTPTATTHDGRLAEWPAPAREANPHAPQMPHLYGLFPATAITPAGTPDLAAAARRTLEARSDEGTGLPMVLRVGCWARLGEGDHAFRLLRDLLRPASADATPSGGPSGTYPNLFFADPNLRLAGNLGVAAGIAEMLVQSDDDGITFLPARPAAWADGEFSGLRVRGGGEVWARWRGREVHAGLRAVRAGLFRIKLPATATDIRVRINDRAVSCPVTGGAVAFPLSPDDAVEISWRTS